MSYYKSSYLVDQQDNCEPIRLIFALVGHEYPSEKINYWLALNERSLIDFFLEIFKDLSKSRNICF